MSDTPAPRTVYLDLTHLGRHVTGLERISIDLFEKVQFEAAHVVPLRSRGLLSMIWIQQVVLPWLALRHPRALFVFPGFPPSVLMSFARRRVVLYVHDVFLITRWQDLGLKAKLYMALPFRIAVSRLKYFLVNSNKTRSDLKPFTRADSAIALYRPQVANVFGLAAGDRAVRGAASALKIVMVGTVEPRKNYAAALDILDALARHGHGEAELHVIGREGWGDVAARLARHPRVRMHGYLSIAAARDVIEAADVYLSTSHDEGLGLPLLEVQFAGLPVVAPDAPVFREVLSASGTFIDTSCPDAAACVIAELVAATGWRARATEASLANVASWNAATASDGVRARAMFARGLEAALAGDPDTGRRNALSA